MVPVALAEEKLGKQINNAGIATVSSDSSNGKPQQCCDFSYSSEHQSKVFGNSLCPFDETFDIIVNAIVNSVKKQFKK